MYSSEITSGLCLRIRFKDLPRPGLTLGIVGSLRVNFRNLQKTSGKLRKSSEESLSINFVKKSNGYSQGVQFGINCSALNQLK